MGAGRIRIDGDSSAVVVDAASAVGKKGDSDAIAEASHRFVDGVVDHFPNEVVKTSEAC
jgi:hypothetical protein